jgi:hypothetical protein
VIKVETGDEPTLCPLEGRLLRKVASKQISTFQTQRRTRPSVWGQWLDRYQLIHTEFVSEPLAILVILNRRPGPSALRLGPLSEILRRLLPPRCTTSHAGGRLDLVTTD